MKASPSSGSLSAAALWQSADKVVRLGGVTHLLGFVLHCLSLTHAPYICVVCTKNAELFTLTYGALVRQARAVDSTAVCL
jgi:hypothetical protein